MATPLRSIFKADQKMNSVNYSKELDKIVTACREQGRIPTLLLQVCCAPCSSYCLEYLREDFDITVLYYNPNISEYAEYEKRRKEEVRLIQAYNRQVTLQDFASMHSTHRAREIKIMDCAYEGEVYEQAVKGLESCPEGGERCGVCFALRLSKTAQLAAAEGFDFYTTTLTISPLKNAARLNQIGEAMGQRFGAVWLPSDFKKKNGYKRSIELSHQFALYRQNYCGCRFSKEQREREQRCREREERNTQ